MSASPPEGTDMNQIEKVARGLTKAQRKEILSLSGEWVERTMFQQSIFMRHPLIERAVPRSRIEAERLRLTQLGLAVRAELERIADE